ncbi:MAG: VOC family protein [Fimbriimonadales bacterium]
MPELASGPLPNGLRFTPRLGHEPPPVAAQLGWRYHHIGIPTTVARAGEIHLEQFGLFVVGFSSSPYGIEWMRFEKDSPIHELIRTVPHVAFEVDDLDAALEGQTVLHPPGSPSEGVRSAMIIHDGAPVELISFRKTEESAPRARKEF